MFEIKDKGEKGSFVIYVDCYGKMKVGRVSIRAIDVR